MGDKITRPEGMSDAEYIIYLADQISDIKEEEELDCKIKNLDEDIRHCMISIKIILGDSSETWDFDALEHMIVELKGKVRELHRLKSLSKSIQLSDIFFEYQDFCDNYVRRFANMRARERIDNL